MELPNIVLNDRYKLVERLGEGGMAEVYRSEDLRLGREVAVKVLRPQYADDRGFLQRFLHEGRAVANFSHPNVVNVFDIGRDGRRYYIVMEYVPGTDLRELLQQRGRLDVQQALDIARQVALGVGCAHRKGLIHRDIKPGNILITPAGEVKVADFGIAKAMAGATLTEPGVVWGTTAYLSPEQVRGEPALPASDVYSIGVVLYEMLAGVVPFAGEDRVAVALQHLRERPMPLIERNHQVPRGVQYLVERALEKDPAQRYETADDFARALTEYKRGGTATTTPSDAVVPPVSRPRTPAGPVTATPETILGTARRPATQGPPHTGPRPRAGRTPATAAPQQGLTAFDIMLTIIVIAMILGLIPLYWEVYQRFLAPLGAATSGAEIASLWMTFLL